MHKKFSLRRLVGILATALMISGAGFIAIQAPAKAAVWSDCNTGLSAADINSGNIVVDSLVTGKCIITFKNNQTFTLPSGLTHLSESLVVGGGGGGGFNNLGGGGGGGRVLHRTSSWSVSGSTSLEIVIGAGGADGWRSVPYAATSTPGDNGGDTIIKNATTNTALVTAGGGGGGCGGNSSTGITYKTGFTGSPGGACAGGITQIAPTVAISGWDSFANNGGAGGGGGGGGAGTAGADGATRVGGNGLTKFGLAVGAGGGGWGLSPAAVGGSPSIPDPSNGNISRNIGGNAISNTSFDLAGADRASGSNGMANTGSGGGAARDGGSGVVKIAYVIPKTVTFNANGGSGTMAAQTANGGTLNANSFSAPTGSFFSGWNTLANGTGTNYAAGATWTFSADTTLYAIWTNPVINLDASDASSLPTSGASWTSIAPGTSSLSSTTLGNQTFTAGPPKSLALPERGYVNMGANNDANISGAITVEVWAKCSAYRSGNSWNILASKWFSDATIGAGGTAAQDWHFGIYGDKLNLYTTNSAYKAGNTTVTSSSCSTWHQYAFTIDPANNNTLTLYIDGVVDGTFTGVTHTTNASSILMIGDGRVAVSFQGNYSKFRMYKTALTSAQMAQNFSSGSSSLSAITVTYKAGANGTGTDLTQSFTNGNSVTLNDATAALIRAGYSISGWSTTDGAAQTHALSATYSTNSDLTLYPVWSANTYSVTYKSGSDGTGSDLTQSFTFGSNPTLKSAAQASGIARTGYSISGWSTSDQGSKTHDLSSSYSSAANLILYPVWAANTYTITYSAGTGGSGADITQSFIFGNTATLEGASAALTKTGYSISGWSTTNQGTKTHNLSSSYSAAANLTLYPVWSVNTYTITYKPGTGGTGSDLTQSFTYGNTATIKDAAAPLTRDGYTITAWSTTDGGSTSKALAASYGAASDLTLYPVWSANTYNVTYEEQGGSAATNATYQTGGTLTLPAAPVYNGYTFQGWFTAASGGTKLGNASATISPTTTADISIYAQWVAINYSITYDGNGSGSGSAPTDSNIYNITSNVNVLGNSGNLTLNGYSFGGWTLVANTGTAYNSGESLAVSGNMTFYVKWNANTYTLTYETNGATGAPSVSTKSYTTGGTAITHPTVNTMAKTGYDFAGWSETPTGSVLTGTYTTTSDKTLYAIWTIKSISVTYDKGAASASTFSSFPTTLSTTYGVRATLSSNIDGLVDISGVTYEFLGWSDGTDRYAAGSSYLVGATNVVMTAQWARVYQVQYVLNGGSGIITSDTECLTNAGNGAWLCSNGQVISASGAPTKTGYTFTGWKDQSTNPIAAGAQFTVNSGSYLLYAQWTPTNYTVTYASAGGSTAPTGMIKNYGDIFTVGASVNRTGYAFAGWNDGTTTFGAGSSYQMPASNISLTAQWTANTYSISYDWNGGSGSATANSSYTVGTSGLTLPVAGNHVKDGFSFVGWSETRNGSVLSGAYSPTQSGTLYAVWGSGNYTLTYGGNGGTPGTASASVVNGSSLQLPSASRTSYVFDGWYTATSGGSKLGNAGASYTPGASATVYAHWVQESLYGINPIHLTRLATVNAQTGVQATISGSNAGSSVQVVVPAGALANGTAINVDLVSDFTRAGSLMNDPNNYIVSMVVSWVAPDGTVPNTAAGKPIAVTIQNSTIKAGAKIYSILGSNVTVLGTATQDGTVTVSLTQDPEIVVAATVPEAPLVVTATAGSTGSALVNWNAPNSNGGSTITGYTVTASTGQSCTSATTSCIVTGLTSGASYTFTVTATNAVGTSTTSSASASLSLVGSPITNGPNMGLPISTPLAIGDNGMQIIAVDKKKVATTGGSVVKLDTKNVKQITNVTVDGKPAKILSTVDGQIKVQMPKNSSGEAKVVLSGPDGQIALEQVISYSAPKPVATVQSIAIPQGIWTIATPEMQKLKTALAKNSDAVVITCEGFQSYAYNSAFDALVAKQRAKTACSYLAGTNTGITVVTKVVRTKLTGQASRKLRVTFLAVR